jgi:very-short-patch-repair endonuclease
MANQNARVLRRNFTEAERRLWAALRDRRLAHYKFRRQRSVGPFIADFVCIAHRLVIEADGSQHAENPTDEARTIWLEEHGWKLVRFWNNDILENTEGVLESILQILRQTPPSPTRPSRAGSPLSRERERV